jgi:hypothetical protein
MTNKADNKTMKVTGGEYFTIQEMSSILGESTNTINKRLFRLGIKPIARDALYTKDDLEKIKDIKMGRPPKKDKTPKKPAPEPARAEAKKPAKSKK